MKNKTRILILSLALASLALASDSKKDSPSTGKSNVEPPDAGKFLMNDSSSLVTSVAWGVPKYTRILIGDWFDMRSKGIGERITVPSQFPPEEVTITVTKRPSVHENPDGTWTITF